MDISTWWESIGAWQIPIEVVAIIVGAIIVRLILQIVIKGVVHRVVHRVKRKQGVEDTQAIQASPLAAVRTVQRTRALGGVLSSAVTTIVAIIAVLMIVAVIAPNVTGAFALITAALGAGLGFGAQNVVKDTLNGIFIVAEDQLGVGDVVDLGPATGVVEYVGIRITDLRDVNGTLWHVRNGEILRVGNLSQGWARVIIDLAVPYDADIEAVEERMLETAIGLQNDPKWRRLVLEKPELWGIESISAEAIVVRLVVKTRSASKDDVARELRMRLKRALDDLGVRLPALNSITLSGLEGASSVRGARPPKTAQVAVQDAAEKAAAAKPTTRTRAHAPEEHPAEGQGVSDLTLRMGPGGEPVGGSFWAAVGGRPTFEKLVRALLRGRRRRRAAARRSTPRKTSKAAIQRLTGVPRAVLGRADHLQRGARPPAAPHPAPALRGHPRHARSLAARTCATRSTASSSRRCTSRCCGTIWSALRTRW